MATATIIAACALAVSVVAFLVNYRLARSTVVSSVVHLFEFVCRSLMWFEV
jgi:hypothetical protein